MLSFAHEKQIFFKNWDYLCRREIIKLTQKMLGRIISVLFAFALALPVNSQSLSDGSVQSSPLPLWQTERHAPSSPDSSAMSNLPSAAAQAYSQMPQNNREGAGFPRTRLGRVVVVSAPLIAEGLVAKKLDGRFKGLRNDYIPDFRKSADDYLQYSPFAVMVGLKALGVEGRSSWGGWWFRTLFPLL